MLQHINDLPHHVVGVHAYGEVTEAEYLAMLAPLFDNAVNTCGKINFVLVLETDIENFAPGAWCGSIKIGFKYFFKWKKVAIVTDQKSVAGYSDLFKYFIPGKFKRFPLDQISQSIIWASGK